MSESLAIIVLAAGLGKRMGSDLPKAALRTREKPIIQHVLTTAAKLNPAKVIVVTGFKKELVEQAVRDGASSASYKLDNIKFAVQEKQLGTGHAAKSALDELKDFVGAILILYGDVPLISHTTLHQLLEMHSQSKATLSLLVLKSTKPNAYGRIVRDTKGSIQRIVEFKDCGLSEFGIDEFNPGFYVVDSAFLKPALEALKNDNSQKEYYLTDIIAKAASEGQNIKSLLSYNELELQGVNDYFELAQVNHALLQDQIKALMQSGVSIQDVNSLYLDPNVEILPGACIGPNVQIKGRTKIAANVSIEGSAHLLDCDIHEGAQLKFAVKAEQAVIGKNTSVGPFAHLRPGTVLQEEVKIGNFVETKKAHLAKGAKANHLSYLGDVSVGENSNIGAGTITCNYDGHNKFETNIGKNVFIGSDSCLVAPVKIGDGAYVGAGSVITKDVESDSLALTRAALTSKAGWAKNKRAKAKK